MDTEEEKKKLARTSMLLMKGMLSEQTPAVQAAVKLCKEQLGKVCDVYDNIGGPVIASVAMALLTLERSLGIKDTKPVVKDEQPNVVKH